MTNETLRMQMLAGVITEGEYKAKLQENNNKVDYIINKVGNSFRIFASTPKIKSEKGKPEDAESLFGKGTMWKDYSTNSEAQKAIDSLSNSPFDNKRGIDNKSLNEAMIGGIVGIGAINQIPPREKTDYEMAFEHFLGERYETKFENREQNPYTMEEEKMPAVYSRIKNDDNFQELVAYFKKDQNKDEAEKVKDELMSLKEAYEKDGKYYDEEYGDKKEVTFKEYLKAKLVNIGLPAAALGLVGALMAGPLGAMAPEEILQAIGIAAGIGGAAGAALDYGETKPIGEDKEFKEGEINENIGNDITDFINSFPFSQEGNDELIDFANKLLDGKLSPEEFTKLVSFVTNPEEFIKLINDPERGKKSIAQQIYKRLKQGTASGGGIETFSSNPKALQALISKLPSDSLQEGELASKEEYKIELKDGYYILTYKNNDIHSKSPESTIKFKTKKEAEEAYKKHLKAGASIAKQFADGIASGDPRYQQPY